MTSLERYTIYNPPDGLWGKISENGAWNGMVNEVANGRADIIMSDIIMPFIRHQAMLN